MIEVKNITKSYGDVKALEAISFSVKEAELFGVIGPDGAGKTTLLRILTTLLLPDEGVAKLNNLNTVCDYKQIREIIGYMPGEFSLYQDLTVEENLNFFASVFKTTVRENYHLIKNIYNMLEPFKKRRAGALSGGMKQKLALSCALIHKPKVLVLDEPTTGVDAVSRKEFWENLKDLKKEGITIIVSTPYMDEASLCDRIALMQNGKLMSIDTPSGIESSYNKKLFAIKCDNIYKVKQIIDRYENKDSAFLFGQYIHYTQIDESIGVEKLIEFLAANNINNITINEIDANIEDCFIRLMRTKSKSVSV